MTKLHRELKLANQCFRLLCSWWIQRTLNS